MAYAETSSTRSATADAFPAHRDRKHALLEKEIWRIAAHRSEAATYNLSPEKRTTLEFAIDHLAKQAPEPQKIGRRGAPYGQVLVTKRL